MKLILDAKTFIANQQEFPKGKGQTTPNDYQESQKDCSRGK
jgi:hypothetical protein